MARLRVFLFQLFPLLQVERVGQALERHFLLPIPESIVLARGQLHKAMQPMLDGLCHASDKDVRVSDLRKSDIMEFGRRYPWRRGRFENCGAVPGPFESLADPDIVLRGLQSGYEYAVGTKLQKALGPA